MLYLTNKLYQFIYCIIILFTYPKYINYRLTLLYYLNLTKIEILIEIYFPNS